MDEKKKRKKHKKQVPKTPAQELFKDVEEFLKKIRAKVKAEMASYEDATMVDRLKALQNALSNVLRGM